MVTDTTPDVLPRDILAQFLPNPRAIKAFENMSQAVADTIQSGTVTDIQFQAIMASVQSLAALDGLARLEALLDRHPSALDTLPMEARIAALEAAPGPPDLGDIRDAIHALQLAPVPAVAKKTGWEVVGSWTYSAPVANVDFTDLGDFQNLLFLAMDVTTSAVDTLQLRFSDDNGATFYNTSGDYLEFGAGGAETAATGISFQNAASATARGNIIELEANIGGAVKPIPSQRNQTAVFVASTAVINAAQLVCAGGANLTAGSATVFGCRL